MPDDPEKLAHLCMRCPTAPQRLRCQGGKDLVLFEDVVILRDKGIVRIMGRRPGCKLIAEVMGSGEAAQTMCERLVKRALEAGGKDNVTVVVARYRFP